MTTKPEQPEGVAHETLRSNWNIIEAQIEAKRAGRRTRVFHGGLLCSSCYENPPRPGQRYCPACHSADEIKRRQEMREKLKLLRAGEQNG